MRSLITFFGIGLLFFIVPACDKKKDDPIKFEKGFFPDTVLVLTDINSEFDDFNMALPEIQAGGPVVFSSNRKSRGGEFDIVQGIIYHSFLQTDGTYRLNSFITEDLFVGTLLNKVNTGGDDLGPYRFFNKDDGFEYMVVSSVNQDGNLDLRYIRNRPQYGPNAPVVEGPFPVSLLNTSTNDGYFCLDQNHDTAYFCSDRNGNFDIFLARKTGNDALAWFNQPFSESVTADSLKSNSDDKCPYVHKNIIVFASDRPGGFGGFDLYYSVLKNGKWNSPKNMGQGINTSSNEYRPVIGTETNFTNFFMIFSSDRPGGKGGYDLYMTGIELIR